MSAFTFREAESLDRWITGNYGEDQYEDDQNALEDLADEAWERQEERELMEMIDLG